MAGLRVRQGFGMFLLPGFGVSSSSPVGTWPGHPTSMCDSGVKLDLSDFFEKSGLNQAKSVK